MPLLALAAGALTAGLALYALGLWLLALRFLGTRPRTAPAGPAPEDAVAALIPARDEGEAALRAIRSLLAQDHRGPIAVHLLLGNAADNAIPLLDRDFPGAPLVQGGTVERLARPGRSLLVSLVGEEAKSAKLNWAAARVAEPWVALLDADHQARPDWIRCALRALHAAGGRMVQGRRGPLVADGFFPLWDALHQHVGCELVNTAFSSLGLTVFFTGTTALIETDLLRSHPLRPCLTEDVDLSYRLLMEGQRVLYDPHGASDEEVSPDLYSFVARRRRWAAGHTEAFLRQLPRLPRAPLRGRDRLQFLFHGLHYLVALPVFALHGLIGLLLARALPAPLLACAGLGALLGAWTLVRGQRTRGLGARAAEWSLAAAWFGPAALIALGLGGALATGDPARVALPLPGWLQLLGLAGLLAPLGLLLAGLWRFGQASPAALLAVLGSYPLAFLLDVCGVLLGLGDLLARQGLWRAVARAARPAEAPGTASALPLRPALGIGASWRWGTLLRSTRGALRFRARWLPWLGLLALCAAGLLLARSGRIPAQALPCRVLLHDTDPWIVPEARMGSWCAPPAAPWTTRTGSFPLAREDDLRALDPAFWERLGDTFPCNQAAFAPEQVEPVPGGGLRLRLDAVPRGGKPCSAGSIATRAEARHLYGRFEAVMKPVRIPGVVSALFLYRFDPWQEIDAEFTGDDTRSILLNVYYNPGEEGDLYNYGYRGTPVRVDLGFDAAEDFHRYAIEWSPGEISWFADDRLIHQRRAGRPTPIPHLPMRFFVNAWPTCSEELAGRFDPASLPGSLELGAVRIHTWSPPPLMRLSAWLSAAAPERWRERAAWIQPGR